MMVLLAGCLLPFPVAAGQSTVFLLDTSLSMNDSDPQKIAPDSLAAMTSVLRASDNVSIITFNTDVSVVRPLEPVGADVYNPIDVNYEGYTNTGAAMAEALAMLESSKDKERCAVLITDGEIMMPGAAATLHSSQQFAASMEQAAQAGIPVHIISLVNGPDDRDYKLYAGYANWQTIPIDKLLLTARDLPLQKLNICAMEITYDKVTDNTGRITELKIINPLPGAKKITARLVATLPGTVAGNYPARVQTLAMTPNYTEWILPTDYPPGTEIKCDLVPEVEGKLIGEAQASRWGDALEVRLNLVTAEGEHKSLLSSEFFEGKSLRLTLDDQECTGTIKNGVITVQLPKFTGERIWAENLRFEDLGVRFIGENAVLLNVERPGFLSWILAALGIGTIGVLYRRLKGKQESAPPVIVTSDEKIKPPAPVAIVAKDKPAFTILKSDDLHYTGRLDIYVTATPDDEDIAPLEYNLFRRAGGKQITLAEIMRGTGVRQNFVGAENILFSPARQGLLLKNNSDATITKRGNIILQGKGTELSYDERIHIAFADEKSEMIVIYKSLKP